MTKRIAAIVFIFMCTTVAWGALGATVFYRTYSSGSALKGRVVSIWGAPHVQLPPSATYTRIVPKTVESVEDGRRIVRTVEERQSHPLPLESSRIDVRLDLDHRQKGLLWYSTYRVAFSGAFGFRNASTEAQDVLFTFPLPAAQAIYEDMSVTVDGAAVVLASEKRSAQTRVTLPAGKTAVLAVSYRSQGLESWRYSFGGDVAQVRDFRLAMSTDFKAIDFPDNSVAPTEKRETATGWDLVWSYRTLLSGFEIAMLLPEKLQPGPLAGEISYFAPVSLLFFFFLIFILTTLRGIDLHPMNYFFLAAAFFAFHLLFAYLVDHVSIHAAFAISSAASVFLVVNYLRLVVGLRFAAVEAGAAQTLYLVLFSYAFFFKGFTGLAVTIGAVLTLCVVMQVTARTDWAAAFGRRPAVPATPR